MWEYSVYDQEDQQNKKAQQRRKCAHKEKKIENFILPHLRAINLYYAQECKTFVYLLK